MKEGVDLARVASLVGDPARANMLSALMDGGALTASELAVEAGVGLPTASSHLAKLTDGNLLCVASQGRHRYYRLATREVATMIEAIMGVAGAGGPSRVRPGPRDAAMREARVCYDHLAGQYAVEMMERFVRDGFVEDGNGSTRVTSAGRGFFEAQGIDMGKLEAQRRPLCRTCLDWSMRRSHLAGALGAAVLDTVLERKWARREPATRVVQFSPQGRQKFAQIFLRNGAA